MTGMPKLSHPVFGLATVTTEIARPWRIAIERRPGIIGRFLQDCRDLWTLVTKGQPADDPLLPWRMMAELAKSPVHEDLDKWEADMFARSGVWWFDPARYDGTPFAWPKRVEPSVTELSRAMSNAARDLGYGQQQALVQQISAQTQMNQLQALQNMGMRGAQANQQMMNWYGGYDILDPRQHFRIKNG